MNKKHLHIVTHDVPFPADYGGVIDLFYKLKALHSIGVKIYLHCFTQGRPAQDELNKYCNTVTYYPRKNNISRFSMRLPYIVNSRISKQLITNLKKDNHPVLLEGIHCTYYLQNGELTDRKVVVRLHNIEFEYYKQMANQERNIFKKLYYTIESHLLKRYEASIANKACFLAVSQQDTILYKELFGAKEVQTLKVFLPHSKVNSLKGKGCFCLYHGNLAINENEQAATWLINVVFSKIATPFYIAGKNPSKKLQRLVALYPHISLVKNPSEAVMQDLISEAQIHILPSFNNTGVKFKLLNAIFNGRHCLVNKAGVEGSGLENYCHLAEDALSFQQQIAELYQQPFTQEEIQNRGRLLQSEFNNEANAKELMTFL